MRKVYHKIIQISGNVITVEADNVAYNELAEVSGSRGTSLAQVIRLQDRKVSLQVFAGARGISTNDEVRFLGDQMKVSASDMKVLTRHIMILESALTRHIMSLRPIFSEKLLCRKDLRQVYSRLRRMVLFGVTLRLTDLTESFFSVEMELLYT